MARKYEKQDKTFWRTRNGVTKKVFRKSNYMKVADRVKLMTAERVNVFSCPHCGSLLKTE